MIRNIKSIFICSLLPILLVVSCKKEVKEILPGDISGGVNFYNGSEVLNSRQSLRKNNLVFINDSVPNGPFLLFPKYQDVYTETSDLRQYPYNATGTIFPNPGFVPTGYQYMYYMPVALGNYKFIFSGTDKVFLKDIQTTLVARNELQSFYLVESPEAMDAYRIVKVPEEYQGTPGKVRIRIVHLGTDSQNLMLKQLDATGNLKTAGLPQDLAFGSFSGYTEIDTVGAARNSGNIILKISEKDAPNNVILSAAVPAEPNGSFVVLIQGFRQATSRRILTGHNADGSPVYEMLTVQPNFRANLRRSY